MSLAAANAVCVTPYVLTDRKEAAPHQESAKLPATPVSLLLVDNITAFYWTRKPNDSATVYDTLAAQMYSLLR